jgi:EAL domain-containing protein (putative c-di-GMP-specific phosphodiesterase class I)
LEIFAEELDGVLSGRIPFSFHFQPVVDLQRGIAVGYEALARFGGRLNWSPDRWFTAAGQLGRRLELEVLVASRTFAARDLLPKDCFLAINARPALLLSDEWDELLANIHSMAGVVIEITEQDPIDDYGGIQQKMASIRAKGGTIAVDDVGSGYASLKHVMEIRPDFLKLYRAFIGGCNLDPARLALIEMIGTTAGRLDAWIVAEGVETRAELEQLIALDVSLAQGYHLGRPAPIMHPVAEETRLAVIVAASAHARTDTVNRAMERCSAHRTRQSAHLHLDRFPDSVLAAVIDEWNRPAVLLERHPLLGIRALGSFLKVQIDSDLNEVLHRALARVAQFRFDPLAVINGRGELEGVIRLDRLMFEALHKPMPDRRRFGPDRIAPDRIALVPPAGLHNGTAD